MERLTIPDKLIEGGIRRAIIDAKAVREEAMKIYWALKKYEDTGLTPEEIMDGKMLTGWIPVEEQLPKKPEENPIFGNKPLELYLVSIKNADYVLRAFWNGTSFTDGWSKLDVIAWMPIPEPYNPEN